MSTWVTKRANELDLKVVDAAKDLTLEVVAEDVTSAKRKNAKCCAFARAAKRQMPKVKAAYFFRTTAYLEYEDKMVRYQLPPAIQKEIVSFDRAQKMEPGVYSVKKPAPTQRLDSDSKFGKGKSWANRSEKAKREKGKGAFGVTRKVRNKTKGVREIYEPADE